MTMLPGANSLKGQIGNADDLEAHFDVRKTA